MPHKFISVTKYGSFSETIYVPVDMIKLIEDYKIVHGKITLMDGTEVFTFENADRIVHLLLSEKKTKK